MPISLTLCQLNKVFIIECFCCQRQLQLLRLLTWEYYETEFNLVVNGASATLYVCVFMAEVSSLSQRVDTGEKIHNPAYEMLMLKPQK